MKEKEIEIDGEKIKVAIKLQKEVIESNDMTDYLSKTVDLEKVVEEIKNEDKQS